jgi:hypothetical protein
MTSHPSPRSARRTARSVAIGAAALGVAVALPAFAIDRGGDGVVDADTAAGAAAPTTTTIDPALEAKARVEAFLDWHASLTPEEKFQFQWMIWTEQERSEFVSFIEAQKAFVAAYLEGLYQAEQAEKARQAAAAAAQAKARVTTSAPAVAGGSVWDRLAQCESGGNWAYPTVSGGYSGGLMFHSGTWNAMGGRAYAATASGATREQQIAVAERVLASSGWGAWPGCSRKLGLR